MALGLYLVFPQRGLEDQLARTNKTDPLTIEYLKAFLAAQPDSPRLSLLLARQQMQLGRYDEARVALRLLLAGEMGEHRIEAELYEYEIREREAFALPEGSAEREAALREAAQQLRRLVGLALGPSQLEFLARRAVALAEPALAVELYRKLAARGAMRSVIANAEAARLVLGLGGYSVAARLYFNAQANTPTPEGKRKYFMLGVATLMAGNLYDEAIGEADRHLGILAGDTEVLKFMARTAQAANRSDAAQRYAKMLLRMALLEQWLRQGGALARVIPAALRGFSSGLEAYPLARIVRASLPAGGPGVPFDEEAYTLGFDIFLAAGNLADAYRVAESAVLQAPQSAEWKKRFAQVAEWRGAPQVALGQWLAHARMTGDEASWGAVQRLARALYDDAVLLLAIGHQIERNPGRIELVDEVVAIHERLGKPDDAIAFLRTRAKGPQRRVVLEKLALLAERAGRDQLAFDTYATLSAEFGATLAWATRMASHHYLTGDLKAALEVLESVAANAAPAETAFWQMYAELARLLQLDARAIAGYRRLLQSEKFSAGDLDNLIALLDAMRPDQAARVAEFAFARFQRPELAMQVIYQYGRAGNRQAIGRFFDSLSAPMLAQLERDASFLSARAAHFQLAGDLRRALADLSAADRIEPDNRDTQAAMLWLLIGLRETARLKAMLVQLAPAAERKARLWGPFAAAHMVLNRQAEALRWFRRQTDQRGDYLWQLAFAESLEANAQPELAWRIRRRAWTELRRPDVLAKIPADQLTAARDRLAALALTFVPGDRAKALVEALLVADLEELRKPAAPQPLPATGAELARALADSAPAPLAAAGAKGAAGGALPGAWFARPDPAAPRHPAADNDATVKELALAWALNNDANELARAWLITRYAGTLSRPLWGELSVALAGADRDTLARLLNDLPDWLPMYDRIEAALRIGAPALARTLAFEQLDHLQADEQLHLRFTTMATEDPARLAAAEVAIRQSPLAINQTRAEASADLTPVLKLGLTLTLNRQSTQDQTQLVNVPQADTTATVFLRHRSERGVLTLSASHRSAMREINGLRLDYELPLAARLHLTGTAGLNQVATELAILRVGGIKDSFDNTLTYRLSNREYLRAGLALHRYRSQDRTDLGRGTLYSLEAGHRLRIEYPDLSVRLFNTRANFTSSGRSDALIQSLLPAALQGDEVAFVPSSFTQWGAGIGWGLGLQDRYTRAPRPFFDLALFRNSLTGSGNSIRLGLAGSLAGQDHATVYFNRSTGTPGAPQGYREFGLSYQWFY